MMHTAASNLTISQLLVVLTAVVAAGAAAAPVVSGARVRRPLEAIAGGLLGFISLCWLGVAFMTEAFCDGTCGRSSETLYVSSSAGLSACLVLAGALFLRAPVAITCSAFVAGIVALWAGAARW